jgi:hypothetical protein
MLNGSFSKSIATEVKSVDIGCWRTSNQRMSWKVLAQVYPESRIAVEWSG